MLTHQKEKELRNSNRDLEKKLIEKEKVEQQGQQEAVPALNMSKCRIYLANGSSEEEEETRPLAHVNSGGLPPWLIRSVMER